MWIIRRRSSARPKPPIAFEALEARFLLATAGTTSSVVPLDSSTIQPTTPGPLPPVCRIDDYDLPASAGYPEVRFQVQWSVSDPAQGTPPQGLLLVLPTNGAPASQYELTAPDELDWTVSIPTGNDPDGPLDWLSIKFQINLATVDANDTGSTAIGTYDLSINWMTSVAPTPSLASDFVVGPTALNGAMALVRMASSPQIAVPSSISVVDKPLPPSDAATLATWLSKSTPAQSPPTVSFAAGSSPTALTLAGSAATTVTIPPVTLPGSVATPGASPGGTSIALGPTGPFLMPSTTPGATPSPHGDARPASPGMPGDGTGPSLIVGPLPLGRSEPDGGVFARSFTSTSGPGGSGGAESLIAVAVPYGVGQSSSNTSYWSGSPGRPMSAHWLAPYGVDPDPSGQSSSPRLLPSPLAASESEKLKRDGVVLLPSVVVAEGDGTPDSAVVDPALGGLSSALAFAVRFNSADARHTGPALPPPPPPGPRAREDSDPSRDWRWGWPAVTIMALVGSAVMIFRLHAAHRLDGRPD